jgi:hypothetical protein
MLRRTLFLPDPENDFVEPAEVAPHVCAALAAVRQLRSEHGAGALVEDGDTDALLAALRSRGTAALAAWASAPPPPPTGAASVSESACWVGGASWNGEALSAAVVAAAVVAGAGARSQDGAALGGSVHPWLVAAARFGE